jgi:hypothetical protein
MGKARAEVKEVRFIIEDELTQVYVFYEAFGDCPLGVQGWHHKSFPKSKSVLNIIQEMVTSDGDAMLWPQNAP